MDWCGLRSYALVVLGKYGAPSDRTAYLGLWHNVQTTRWDAPKPDRVGRLGMLEGLSLARSHCTLLVPLVSCTDGKGY